MCLEDTEVQRNEVYLLFWSAVEIDENEDFCLEKYSVNAHFWAEYAYVPYLGTSHNSQQLYLPPVIPRDFS